MRRLLWRVSERRADLLDADVLRVHDLTSSAHTLHYNGGADGVAYITFHDESSKLLSWGSAGSLRQRYSHTNTIPHSLLAQPVLHAALLDGSSATSVSAAQAGRVETTLHRGGSISRRTMSTDVEHCAPDLPRSSTQYFAFIERIWLLDGRIAMYGLIEEHQGEPCLRAVADPSHIIVAWARPDGFTMTRHTPRFEEVRWHRPAGATSAAVATA